MKNPVHIISCLSRGNEALSKPTVQLVYSSIFSEAEGVAALNGPFMLLLPWIRRLQGNARHRHSLRSHVCHDKRVAFVIAAGMPHRPAEAEISFRLHEKQTAAVHGGGSSAAFGFVFPYRLSNVMPLSLFTIGHPLQL